jgi:trans-2,3-dihydro-3-hydroxyanthranilate isomerase
MSVYRKFRYRVVDVFTEHPLQGNPLAVFPDASAIDDLTMQKIARELNLSETTFVLPSSDPKCAARVRIFTPRKEMLFAGHPTIGTSFVLLDEGVVPKGCEKFLLEEKVGPVPVRTEAGMIWLTTPPIHDGRTFDSALCAKALGLDTTDLLGPTPQLLSAGNPTMFVAVKDQAAVDRADLELAGVRSLKQPGEEPFCVFVFTPVATGAYSRMFAPEFGVVEDPATGSSTGPLALYMMRNKLVTGSRFISEQGTAMGRRSLLHVQIRSEHEIEVGGHVTPLVEATMTL